LQTVLRTSIGSEAGLHSVSGVAYHPASQRRKARLVQFKVAKSPTGLTREVLVEALHSRGLSDVEATGLLHKEPLFNKPWAILPRARVLD